MGVTISVLVFTRLLTITMSRKILYSIDKSITDRLAEVSYVLYLFNPVFNIHSVNEVFSFRFFHFPFTNVMNVIFCSVCLLQQFCEFIFVSSNVAMMSFQ